MKFSKVGRVAAVAALAALTLTSCAANETGASGSTDESASELTGTLVGGGASSQQSAQEAWVAAFQGANPDVTVEYDPAGSGAGRDTFIAGGSAFAGSDRAFKDEEIAEDNFASCVPGTGLIELPAYISPIAVIFNLEGIETLNLDAATVAGIGKDLTRLFNELSGYAIEKKFKRLLVAPLHLRKGLLKHIDQERRNAEAGKPSGIRIKVNSIVDEAIIDGLYRASQAGVPVDIWVRGICGLKPGQVGMSETIRVRSILGRFLEHSRIFSFVNDGDPHVFIGSADMMHRNLDRRVEALVRLTAAPHLSEIETLFDVAMDDRTSSWHLREDGEWERHSTDENRTPLVDLQDRLMLKTSLRRRPRTRR